MPGLVRGMARTAAVVGTATATRNAVNAGKQIKTSLPIQKPWTTLKQNMSPKHHLHRRRRPPLSKMSLLSSNVWAPFMPKEFLRMRNSRSNRQNCSAPR